MSKANIKQAQSILMANGFPLPRFGADGDFGNETMQAFTAAMSQLQELRGGSVAPTPLPAPRNRIDPAGFKKFAPRAIPGTLEALEAAIAHYPELQEPLPLAHWLGQMWVESSGYSTMVENLNYSVDGLLNTFGRHRISAADANKYGRAAGRPADQQAIANIIYGGEFGRTQLGNTQPGDGWRFRGSGYKQITGRANTERSGFTPEQLREDPVASARAAADFFVSRKCVAPARQDNVDAVTRIVNGGTNGLADRRTKTAEAKRILV